MLRGPRGVRIECCETYRNHYIQRHLFCDFKHCFTKKRDPRGINEILTHLKISTKGILANQTTNNLKYKCEVIAETKGFTIKKMLLDFVGISKTDMRRSRKSLKTKQIIKTDKENTFKMLSK